MKSNAHLISGAITLVEWSLYNFLITNYWTLTTVKETCKQTSR